MLPFFFCLHVNEYVYISIHFYVTKGVMYFCGPYACTQNGPKCNCDACNWRWHFIAIVLLFLSLYYAISSSIIAPHCHIILTPPPRFIDMFAHCSTPQHRILLTAAFSARLTISNVVDSCKMKAASHINHQCKSKMTRHIAQLNILTYKY